MSGMEGNSYLSELDRVISNGKNDLINFGKKFIT